MEGKPELTIEGFVVAVNQKIKESEDFGKNLNKAVTDALPEDEKYFNNLDEFANFLPKAIQSHLNQKEIKEKLGNDWENFEIKEKDLQELYKINLNLDTKEMILEKFNCDIANLYELSEEEDITLASETFKKILGNNKVSVYNFYHFIYYNFKAESISSKNMDNIISCVTLEDAEEKFTGWEFWNVCITLKEQPSQEFINLMVKNTDFNNLDSDQLISSIIILMCRHSEYLGSSSKGNIVKALGDILDGNEPYQEFSKKLLAVPDIGKKIKWETIISSDDSDVQGFAYILASNGIKIELNSAGETSKFTVKEEEYSFDQFGDSVLIKLLGQEPELNQWIKDVFTLDEKDVVNEDAKNCSLIGKIDSMAALASEKATAIKSFIEQSKDNVRLKKMYGTLLGENQTELLSSVKLDNKTVAWAVSGLYGFFSGYDIIQFDNDDDNGSIAQLQSFITSWKQAVKNQENDIHIGVPLGNFICLFKDQFDKDDFVKLLDLNIWELSENALYGYELSNILHKVKDGCISDNFLNMIKDQRSVYFSHLWHNDDTCFGECLFTIIEQLIRTSKNYDPNDPEKQKQAINDVLKDGNDYQWFRDGLKTFFEKAKDKNGRTANDIVVNQILEELPYFKTLLDNCNMELKFDSDQKELRPEEILEVKIDVETEEKSEEKSEEAQPPKGAQPQEEKQEEALLEQVNNKEEVEQNMEINEKKEQLEKKQLENQKEKNIANDQLNDAVIGGNENDKAKKSKFPTWAKVLIGLGILAVAVLALLFGFGVLGTVFGIAAVGTAKTVALVVAVLALFAELIYLAVLYAMSQDNENPDGRSSGAALSQNGEGNDWKNNERSSLLGKGQNMQGGKREGETPLLKKIIEIRKGRSGN
ncbi:MAG: hypothetical protein IJU86_04570 [Firmicutes bacterium]|nr:hypothetical protein [Bacillota bacterium]